MLLIIVLLLSATLTAAAQEKPNFIIVFADDLGYGDLGCYGHPTIRTPNLDRMAQEGVKLTAYYAAASVCTPSRAGLLTGRYPLRAGMPGNLGPGSPGGLDPHERTLAEALKSRGYHTAAFGKWHLGSVPGFMPTERGFDEYLGLLYSNDMIPPWVNTDRPLHLYQNMTPTDEQPVDQSTLTRRYTDEAIEFIMKNQERPFFIYLPYAMPHLPVYASQQFQNKSVGGQYGDVIEEIDFNVGRILETLKNEELEKNTLVIFTSDNGPWRNMPPRMYETAPVEKWHGGSTGALRGAKATSYEGGYRVPCLIRWPDQITPGQVIPGMVTAMDLHATVLELAGAVQNRPIDGKNIWSMLTGGAPSTRAYFYYFRNRTLEAVRDKTWKLRIAPAASNWTSPELQRGKELPVNLELYNLKNDPYEQFNMAEQNPEVVKELERQMEIMAEELGADLHVIK